MKTSATVAGITTIRAPASKLYKKFAKDGVITLAFLNVIQLCLHLSYRSGYLLRSPFHNLNRESVVSKPLWLLALGR